MVVEIFSTVKKYVIKVLNILIIHFYGSKNQLTISVYSLYKNSLEPYNFKLEILPETPCYIRYFATPVFILYEF